MPDDENGYGLLCIMDTVNHAAGWDRKFTHVIATEPGIDTAQAWE